MPTVRYTSDGGCYRDNDGNRADPDDPLLEVDADTAEVLVEQFRFEHVDEPDEWHDWNPDDWLELGYEQRVDDVQAGRVDEHLGKIKQVETSETVKDAVEDRQED